MKADLPIPLIVLGTGGNCIDILETVLERNDRSSLPAYKVLGFLDDDPAKLGRRVEGFPVLGPLSSACEHLPASFINGIGSPRNFQRREEIVAKTGLPLERFDTIVHPTASVSRSASIGRGTAILQLVTVASRARVNEHVTILANSVINHDVEVGAYTCIASGVCISGGVKVGRSCYLGTNCAIIGDVAIGEGSMIGMGSVVRHDVPRNSVVVGNPARLLARPTN